MNRSMLALALLAATAGLSHFAARDSRSPVVWTDEAPDRRSESVAAATVLRDILVSNDVYPAIAPRCLAFEIEAVNATGFDFAARFNYGACGHGDPGVVSNLLDRFRVYPGTAQVLWYDAPDIDHPYKPLAARAAVPGRSGSLHASPK